MSDYINRGLEPASLSKIIAISVGIMRVAIRASIYATGLTSVWTRNMMVGSGPRIKNKVDWRKI